MTRFVTIECIDCGHQAPFSPTSNGCPKCGSQWREARYDYDSLAETLPHKLRNRPFDLWRYLELLPVRSYNPRLSLGEGGTPLLHAANLGMMLGCPNLYIKDERRGPTISFKDRQAAVNIAALKEAGITEAVLASTGNVAIAFSAYAARAGIKLWAFLTSLVPGEKMREVALYGTQVVKVTASYDQTKQVAAEFARQRNLFYERGVRNVASVEAMKTLAFEIAEQLAVAKRTGGSVSGGHLPAGKGAMWSAPDWYIQAVSGGLGPLGVQKGFAEMAQMGWIDHVPSLGSIQTAGCAPMVHAFQQGLDEAEPIRSPRTHISTLSTGSPGRTYTLLRQRMKQTQEGAFESVSDEEAFRAMHILAKMEGISVEPATAVAFAGLFKLIRSGTIKPYETVVVNCSGHTIPIENTALGEGWARNIVIPKDGPEEGLLAALSRLGADRFPRIAIVDDTADARRLIRRILQAQGDYTIFEAANGQEAVELAKRELPNLIILDLMMPEIDGFGVMDILKQDAATADIPIIVVTAKELTSEEKRRLEGRIHALMQKGEFMNDELLDEVRALVK
ncbi:MAG: pyridoxal-phosphate dependent enzyme [Anaerolineales bacterium]